ESGSRAAQRVDRVVGQAGCLGVGGLEVLKPGGDLAGQVDVPIAHTGTIANPIVDPASRLTACRLGGACRQSSRFASHGAGVGAVPPQRAGLFTSSGMGADGLLAWAERTGRRQTAQPGRGALRFAFYGRVSTEDYQDPVTSRARQLGQAGALVAGHGQIVAEFFDIGQSRTLTWARRPQAAALAAALADPDRGWDAIVIGEYERAFYGSQYASMAPLFEHYGVQLWMPEAGGRVDYASEHDERAMTVLGLSSKREITRTSIRVRAAMAAKTREQGRY